jgi:hypothetical protein
MPRNHYTRLIHREEGVRVAGREQELIHIARKLPRPYAEPRVMASDNEAKDHRRNRLERKQWDKAGQVRPVGVSQS